MTKPVGPLCNLDCKYCFYLEKVALFPANERFKMDDTLLEAYVRDYIRAQPGPVVSFAWQGGEPTLAGLPFYRKAVAWQKEYAEGKAIENAFQTNGTLLDDDWCQFLRDEGFLVGISIDGPPHLHDACRVDRGGEPTSGKVMRAIERCVRHRVEFNTLTVLSRTNVGYPHLIYQFLVRLGSRFLQFIPLVERPADADSQSGGCSLAEPPDPRVPPPGGMRPPVVSPWTVSPEALGRFYCKLFDHWIQHDVGKVYVQLFDASLGKWLNMPGGPCVFAAECGRGLALEHNGDLYACDHYVYPRYLIGNILQEPLTDLVDSPAMQNFGADKQRTLPQYCRECPVLFACNGDCPKHRFAWTPDGEYGLSYLCPAYRRFFKHCDKAMRTMAALHRSGRAPAEIMNRRRRK